ncbi:MAG: fibronectin type III domain-containing protein [Planctomycetota bacterium]|jgi:hypothetical protein
MSRMRKWHLGLVLAIGLAAGAAIAWAGAKEVELDDSEIFFEFNSTDNHLGAQIFLDGTGWKRMKIYDPCGKLIAKFKASGPMTDIGGITELRLESAEPSPAGVLAAFGEGEYEFEGRSVDGTKLVGTGELSHTLADAPTFTLGDEDGEVDPDDAVVEWDEIDGVVFWEVIVADEELGTEFFVKLPADVTEMKVPPEFLEPGTEYKIEILAINEYGNKTITELEFETEAEDGDD